MTAPTETELVLVDRASYVGSIVEASLQPGGPLHADLSDLLTGIQAVAMTAAGLSDGDIEAGAKGWPESGDEGLEGQIVGEIVEVMFQQAKAYLMGKYNALVPAS